jgi:phage protein D
MSKFSSLAKKYDNFSIPAYKIICGGAELKRSEFTFTEIYVDNCIGKTAGAARFSIADIYEHGSRNFSAKALKSLTPGTEISIELGYGSNTTEVFTGYIDELIVRYDTEMTLTALCLDARALMRNGIDFLMHKDKKIQDVVSDILGKYKPLVSSCEVKLDSLEQNVNISQSLQDLDFIIRAGENRGLDFYIDCGKAYLSPPANKTCVDFDWEEFTLDFSIRYLDEKITAYGYDSEQMKPFSAMNSYKQKAKSEKLLTVEKSERLPHYISSESAGKYVKAISDRRIKSAICGTLHCIGLPEIKLGQNVKINKFPLTALSVPDTLQIIAISHRFDTDAGFKSEISVEGS